MTGKEIFDLIKSFEASTKKKFSLYCKSAYTSSGWLYLYRQIDKAKTFNEDKIRGKKLLNNNDYWAARMQLLRHLITCLYVWRKNDDCFEDDRLVIARDLGMYDFLAKQLKKEFKKAKREGKVWRIMELEEIRESLRVIPGIPIGEIFTQAEVDAGLEDAMQIVACKRYLSRIRAFMKQGASDEKGRLDLADEIESELEPCRSNSYVVQAYHLKVDVRIALLRENFAKMVTVQSKLVDLLEVNATTSGWLPLLAEIKFMITILVVRDDFLVARAYLSKLRKIDLNTPLTQKLGVRMSAEMGILLAAAQLDLHLYKISIDLISGWQGNFVYYLTTGTKLAFYCEDFDYAMELLRTVLNMKKDVWEPYAWYLLPLEAMIRYEQNDFDEAERLISRTKSRGSLNCAYADLMLSTLAELMKTLPHAHGEVLASASRDFRTYASTTEGESKVERFDFGAWLGAKMENLPITDIIRNRETSTNARKVIFDPQEFL